MKFILEFGDYNERMNTTKSKNLFYFTFDIKIDHLVLIIILLILQSIKKDT
jgi:hypothetical protein